MYNFLWLTFLCLSPFLEYAVGLALPDSRTCVIGAGYSGLAAARYLKQYGVNFTVFEASRHFGGTWRFDPHVGTDEDGIPVFTSMYKNLRTNTPRMTMEYGGYPFPEGTPSYPTGTCFYKYLKSFVKHFGFEENIQFRSYVMSVKWANRHWELTYMNTADRANYTVPCDFVIVASGQYIKPKMASFPGMDTFRGKIIHSHDYRDPAHYEGRRVLLLGSGASGLDLAMHLSNVTAKLVHSHHRKYNEPYFSDRYVKKPDIKEFTPNGVIFEDGTFEEIDDAIFCTGYFYSHPFVDKSSGLTLSGKFVLPLYRHIVNIRHPSMTFLGVVNVVITRTMDAQAEYVASLIAGKFKLPSQEDMLRSWLDHVHTLQANNKKIVDVNTVGDDMDNYFANLTAEAGVARVPPIYKEIRDFNAVNRLDDLLNYRDYDYEVLSQHDYKRSYMGQRSLQCPLEI
ncbi:senecionine N-oxygenase-like [Aricia agestis]|uniref:senecionine N-oxygenase-like n=1 Tax=Aricia agestis TaxID=91739 RepID=UPI001C20A753|nr:senecionine N-oxygenase-like [Aricia agestis]